MNVKLLDFVDFEKSSPFAGIFGRPRTLAWPINAFRVTMPSYGHDPHSLNPFEQVIRGVLEVEPGMSLDELADDTRIPKDLIRSVLLRLHDKKLIDDNRRPVKQSASDTRPDRESRIVTAVVFQEAVSGRLLPHIQLLDDESPLRIKTREDFRYYEGRVLRPTRAKNGLRPPRPREIISALRQARQRNAAFGRQMRLPDIAQIRVANDSDRFLLECPIAIQRSDADYRIADPFGNGFTLVLEEVFATLLTADEQLQEWMTAWRTSLSAPSATSAPDRQRQPFEAEPYRSRYPNLVFSLVPGRSGYRSIAKIYASLEWALFYCADARDTPTAIEVLRTTRADAWKQRLADAAAQIGLDVPPAGFRAIPEGRLMDLLNGKAEMSTVLAAALIQAERDAQHPLREVSARQPDFLAQIESIKSLRDARAHGEVSSTSDGESRFDPLLRDCVSVLIPGIQFGASTEDTARSDTAQDQQLDARTSLIGELGYSLMNRLPGSARDALVEAEQEWRVHRDGDDAIVLVGRLYAAMQAVTRDVLSGRQSAAIPEAEYRIAAAARAADAGLGELPNALAAVRPERIREAMFGNGSTLGACTMALLVMLREEELADLAATQASLLKDIGQLAALRGHGNEPIPLTSATAKAIRKSSLHSIRTLMEA